MFLNAKKNQLLRAIPIAIIFIIITFVMSLIRATGGIPALIILILSLTVGTIIPLVALISLSKWLIYDRHNAPK